MLYKIFSWKIIYLQIIQFPLHFIAIIYSVYITGSGFSLKTHSKRWKYELSQRMLSIYTQAITAIYRLAVKVQIEAFVVSLHREVSACFLSCRTQLQKGALQKQFEKNKCLSWYQED